MYIKPNDFDTFEEHEDLGREWEIELEKSKIRRQVLHITEPEIENNKKKKNTPRPTINMKIKIKIFKTGENKIYLQFHGYHKDILDHNTKRLIYTNPTHNLHSKIPLKLDFCKNPNLDSEIIKINFSTTGIIN